MPFQFPCSVLMGANIAADIARGELSEVCSSPANSIVTLLDFGQGRGEQLASSRTCCACQAETCVVLWLLLLQATIAYNVLANGQLLQASLLLSLS